MAAHLYEYWTAAHLYELDDASRVVVDLAVDDDVVAGQVPRLLDGERRLDGAAADEQEAVDDAPAQLNGRRALQLDVVTDVEPPQHQERLARDRRAQTHQLQTR